MTGPHVLPFLPAFVPRELCDTVGVDPTQPGAIATCVDIVRTDVGGDGVSARGASPEQVAALQQVVTDARDDGIDLKIVVMDRNPAIDTPLRDVATEVGEAYPDSTVLVLSPSYAGTYSTTFDRATLEAGQDLAKTGDPVQSSANFVSQLETGDFPWTALTIVLVVGVLAATVATRLLQIRSKCARADKTAESTVRQA
ncbi:Rv1476 family membrane protein [Mycolicibacterium arseniciresistens]|uniref:Uncharacterized protein n=1 Tax=Mycolicibacterium arseniciresistens TaxID=3062257 RepID=A0ABT8UML0_9MYCO|nr:DUF6676 family protein [Mycolicibacterium arseniciresistens]MDO3638381.1 hypothetical protein [Mycolicibacterium arseniciresistens]